MALTACGFFVAGIVGLCMWWVYSRMLLMSERRRKGGRMMPSVNGWVQRLPLWRKGNNMGYELLDRREV